MAPEQRRTRFVCAAGTVPCNLQTTYGTKAPSSLTFATSAGAAAAGGSACGPRVRLPAPLFASLSSALNPAANPSSSASPSQRGPPQLLHFVAEALRRRAPAAPATAAAGGSSSDLDSSELVTEELDDLQKVRSWEAFK